MVRCSSGLGRHRGPGRTSGGLIKFSGWPGQHIDHGWTMLRRWWGVILPVVCCTLRNDLPGPHVVKLNIATITAIMMPVMPTMTPTIHLV